MSEKKGKYNQIRDSLGLFLFIDLSVILSSFLSNIRGSASDPQIQTKERLNISEETQKKKFPKFFFQKTLFINELIYKWINTENTNKLD